MPRLRTGWSVEFVVVSEDESVVRSGRVVCNPALLPFKAQRLMVAMVKEIQKALKDATANV